MPYANIEKGKVVSWKTVAPAEGEKKPATEAPAAPAKPAAAQSTEVLPLPKTRDGKLDGSKLVAGKSYKAADGSVKIWNGSGWQ